MSHISLIILVLLTISTLTANLQGQAVATFPLINPNYKPNTGDKPIIPLRPQVSSKQPLDPNDYIGVDISKMSSSERAKIESAFRKHTGQGFTGSKYDPNSPNFAFGPTPTAHADNQDKITVQKVSLIMTILENYKAMKISQEKAMKLLEEIGITGNEAEKLLVNK